MDGSSFGLRTLVALIALSLVASVAAAGTTDDVTQDAEATTHNVDGAVDNVTNATSTPGDAEEPSLADDVGDAFAAVGATIADAAQAAAAALGTAALAIGDGLVAGASAVGTGLAWLGARLVDGALLVGDGAAWLGHGVWAGITAVAAGTQWVLIKTGQGLANGAIAIADGVAWVAVTVGQGLTTVATMLGSLVWEGALGFGRAWSNDPAQHGVVAASASGSAAAAGTAWYTRAWKYLKFAPGLAPLYTRISRDELLEHPTRAQIHEAIQETPGIHLSQLSRSLELSWGTLLHHLRKLEDANLVTSEETQGKRCFFLPGQVSSEERSILPALENEKARKIAEFYAANPGASQSEAAEALGYSPALISWHLNKLEEAGVVERERVGRRHQVGITQEALAVVSA